MKTFVAKCAALALLSVSVQAHAATLSFALTGDYTASWELDSNPTPDFSGIFRFDVNNVSGTYGGVAGTRTLSFATSGDQGGMSFDFNTLSALDLAGPQIFSGTTASPLFAPGTFTLVGANQAPGTYSLTISQVAPPVPEPVTWATMTIGFGLVGGAVRYRRRSVRASFA